VTLLRDRIGCGRMSQSSSSTSAPGVGVEGHEWNAHLTRFASTLEEVGTAGVRDRALPTLRGKAPIHLPRHPLYLEWVTRRSADASCASAPACPRSTGCRASPSRLVGERRGLPAGRETLLARVRERSRRVVRRPHASAPRNGRSDPGHDDRCLRSRPPASLARACAPSRRTGSTREIALAQRSRSHAEARVIRKGEHLFSSRSSRSSPRRQEAVLIRCRLPEGARRGRQSA